MSGGKVEKIERALDAGAALLFGAAAGFASLKLFASFAAASATGVVALAGTFAALRRVPVADPKFDLPEFIAEGAEPAELGELVLTDADRWQPPHADAAELVLDDILAELSPDSRVVRLFDPAAMPAAGELNQNIERHLGMVDASQQLYEALDELRRSLR